MVCCLQALADTDRELLPLLECFMTLAHQLGASYPIRRQLALALYEVNGVQQSLFGFKPIFVFMSAQPSVYDMLIAGRYVPRD